MKCFNEEVIQSLLDQIADHTDKTFREVNPNASEVMGFLVSYVDNLLASVFEMPETDRLMLVGALRVAWQNNDLNVEIMKLQGVENDPNFQ